MSSTYLWKLNENDEVAVTIRREGAENGPLEEVQLRFPSLEALAGVLPKLAKAMRKDGGRTGQAEL